MLLGGVVRASFKMCKNSAGPRFLCVPGSAERFVLPKEKMASSIVFRPFSSSTRVFPSSKHFVANSFPMPEKCESLKFGPMAQRGYPLWFVGEPVF